jgi:hypothetical protein
LPEVPNQTQSREKGKLMAFEDIILPKNTAIWWMELKDPA